jgi:hypothetical protein
MVKKEKGFVLIIALLVVLIFTITGMTVLTIAQQEITLSRTDEDKAAAFYLAEAGLAKMQEQLQSPVVGDINNIIEQSLEIGSYKVELDTSQSPCYLTSTGTSGNVDKKVRIQVTFLAPPYEHAIYAMNDSGSNWDFQLRGTGNPVPKGPGLEIGGKDIINGNIFIDGDAYFFEESSVNPAPIPNPLGMQGDVGATGSINVDDSADISGDTYPYSELPDIVDLVLMDYENNNTHNVSQIFDDAGVSSGYLPLGSELRDVFVKNPSDRSSECTTTTGDDFFFEPSTGFIEGNYKTAETPLDAGQNRVYYIDGDLWIHSKNDTFGFSMTGKSTIVVTGNIHICDNLEYADEQSMLGLVALGKYSDMGELTSGGNVYFGDPTFGTMYVTSGMMFAANDFLFNTDPISSKEAEPSTGFTVNGNFAAMGQVNIERDWYTEGQGWSSADKTARYDPYTNQWVDAKSGVPLTQTQIDLLRHYQMIVNYDHRVRTQETRPPGLPRGGIKIFGGFSNWQEL